VATRNERLWSWMFLAAALFNFVIGFPIMAAREWTFAVAFAPEVARSAGIATDLWADFGYCVALIGFGYLVVAFDTSRNRALVWLGIFAKAFDVVVLTWRFVAGVTRPIVLVPAGIDAAFLILFACFLHATRRRGRGASQERTRAAE
jgi:hypothetical protein